MSSFFFFFLLFSLFFFFFNVLRWQIFASLILSILKEDSMLYWICFISSFPSSSSFSSFSPYSSFSLTTPFSIRGRSVWPVTSPLTNNYILYYVLFYYHYIHHLHFLKHFLKLYFGDYSSSYWHQFLRLDAVPATNPHQLPLFIGLGTSSKLYWLSPQYWLAILKSIRV